MSTDQIDSAQTRDRSLTQEQFPNVDSGEKTKKDPQFNSDEKAKKSGSPVSIPSAGRDYYSRPLYELMILIGLVTSKKYEELKKQQTMSSAGNGKAPSSGDHIIPDTVMSNEKDKASVHVTELSHNNSVTDQTLQRDIKHKMLFCQKEMAMERRRIKHLNREKLQKEQEVKEEQQPEDPSKQVDMSFDVVQQTDQVKGFTMDYAKSLLFLRQIQFYVIDKNIFMEPYKDEVHKIVDFLWEVILPHLHMDDLKDENDEDLAEAN